MKFEQAMAALRDGYKVRRKIWNNSLVWVVMIPAQATQVPQKYGNGYPVESYLMLHTANDTLVPFVMSCADVMSEDWAYASDTPVATSATHPRAMVAQGSDDND